MTIDKQTRQRKIRGSTAESRCGVHDEVSETQQRSKEGELDSALGCRVDEGKGPSATVRDVIGRDCACVWCTLMRLAVDHLRANRRLLPV